MVPYCVLWKSLGFFFAKNFSVSFVFFRDVDCFVRGGGSDGNLSQEVSVFVEGLWLVRCSRHEASLFGIRGSKYNREVSVVYPSFAPVDFRLRRREPGVS